MKLNPPLKAMHRFGATIAQGCVTLFMYDIRTLALVTQAYVPTYARIVWTHRDPGPVVTSLATVGDEVSDLHARRMRTWLEDRPQEAFGRHRYDPADFGWTYPGLADEFSHYTERYLVD